MDKWGRTSLLGLRMEDSQHSEDDAAVLDRIFPAQEELWRYLDSGSLVASAVDTAGNYVEIDKRLWSRLSIRANSLDDFHSENAVLHVPNTKLAFSQVEFRSADIMTIWPPAESTGLPSLNTLFGLDQPVATLISADFVEPSTARKKRGRPLGYDWPAFTAELLQLLDEEGAPDPAVDVDWNQLKIEDKMKGWCRMRWKKEPSTSAIRKSVSATIAAFTDRRRGS